MICLYLALHRSSAKCVIQLAQIEESPLPFFLYLEGLLNQEHRSQNTFLQTQSALVTGHVRLHVPRATYVHLDAPLHHLPVLCQCLMVGIDPQLGDPIAPLRPSLLCVIALDNSLFELVHEGDDGFFVGSSILPPLLEVLVGDFIEGHFSGSGSDSNNFSLISNQGQNLFCELNGAIEVLY